MICRDCPSCAMGWIKAKPEEAWCIGVPEPFRIDDIDMTCTEYFDTPYEVASHTTVEFSPDRSYTPKFIMLVGIPGSGKSTKARELSNQHIAGKSVVHISSDAIRGRIYGNESCQNDHGKVFSIMHEETINALNSGHTVVYDATNITRKNRKEILDKVPNFVSKECIICWAPIDVCIERDKARDRTVGEAVIDKMLRRFEAPYYDEGFSKIAVSIDGLHYHRRQYYIDLLSAINIPHNNPHHTADILEHCRLCGIKLIGEAPDFIVNAGFVHDIGKAYTKTFKNRKGEESDIAHYYDHQAVGAWLSYGIEGHSPTLAWLISTHMAPFINQKYYNSLPPLYKEWIDKLHAADLAAH